jgi:hypothetical protein
MTHEAMQLVLVKQFADEADRMLTRETAFGDGQAISMMQDAVELLIRAVALTRNIESARDLWRLQPLRKMEP